MDGDDAYDWFSNPPSETADPCVDRCLAWTASLEARLVATRITWNCCDPRDLIDALQEGLRTQIGQVQCTDPDSLRLWLGDRVEAVHDELRGRDPDAHLLPVSPS